MCTLAIYTRVLPGLPIVVAANRDEFAERPAAEPGRLLDEPVAVGGRDLEAGGTWLGLNAAGLVAALLNRRSRQPADKQKRSRGLLCLEALRHRGAGSALARLQEIEPQSYNPFNLLIADCREAGVISNYGGKLRLTVLEPGLHLLTNLDVDDPTCPRIANSVERFREAGEEFSKNGRVAGLTDTLQRILADHTIPVDPRDRGPLSTLCVHAGPYGTQSSTVILCESASGRYSYWHAPGPPCRTSYAPVHLGF